MSFGTIDDSLRKNVTEGRNNNSERIWDGTNVTRQNLDSKADERSRDTGEPIGIHHYFGLRSTDVNTSRLFMSDIRIIIWH
jgi:hypothetical protein